MKKEHNHDGVTSNTKTVFTTFIGCTVRGFLREDKADILVFECGYGLAINYNGAHWTVSKENVKMLIKKARNEHIKVKKELSEICKLAGDLE